MIQGTLLGVEHMNKNGVIINTASTGGASAYSVFSAQFLYFSNSLIIHEAKTKGNHKRDGFGNVIKPLQKIAKLSPSFSPEVRICLRSCIKHSCLKLRHTVFRKIDSTNKFTLLKKEKTNTIYVQRGQSSRAFELAPVI